MSWISLCTLVSFEFFVSRLSQELQLYGSAEGVPSALLYPPGRMLECEAMNPPRILLVDDQQQVSRVLRSSLELSDQEYYITEVSSAEEALAEIDRGPVDLVVTDYKLPGLSGLELIERLSELRPLAKAVLISGSADENVRFRAEQLGVVHFFRKPIGTSFFLEVVQHALKLADADREKATRVGSQITDRLVELRQELGAEGVFLLRGRGEIMAGAGELSQLDLDTVVPSLMLAHRAGLKVTSHLMGEYPSSFQHFNGVKYDIYLTSVGRDHALLIAFLDRQGAGQLGSVVHFGRRAAEAILTTLEQSATRQTELVARRLERQQEAIPAMDIEPEDLEEAAKSVDQDDAEGFWDEAVASTTRPQAEGDELTYEQARELGLLGDED